MKAVIYLRVSTANQNPENQLRELQDYADAQEFDIVEIITDKGVSGSKSSKERAGLDKVLKMAHQKKYDVLLFWSLDRLSREGTAQTLDYLKTLTDNGIDYHSYTEQYLSSLGAFSDVVISLLATIAKQERIRISERVKAGLDYRKNVLKKSLGRQKGTKLKGTDDKVALAKTLREDGLSYGKIGLSMNISRQRACQLVQM
ncbi:recombinase family protein [Pontiellaceae bacterium B12227]|nr:recombinase family protein [Pontiellaceae bacterium B12227]